MQTPFVRRFNARSSQIEIRPDGGIVLVARPLFDASEKLQSALCLVADLEGLGGTNDWASATNAMEIIIGHFGAEIARYVDAPLVSLIWVQLDSMGCFDYVHPIWTGGLRIPFVRWAAMHAPRCFPRSIDAFKAVWGETAEMLLADVAKQGIGRVEQCTSVRNTG